MPRTPKGALSQFALPRAVNGGTGIPFGEAQFAFFGVLTTKRPLNGATRAAAYLQSCTMPEVHFE
jgi:hypothetical protein